MRLGAAGLTAPSRPPPLRPHAGDGVLVGGLVVGVLDLNYAFILSGSRGTSPLRLLQSVASGLLGSSAFDRGVPAGILGLACHFTIAFGAATVYYLAARRLPVLTERPYLSGTIFGILAFLFMNFVVIPLSAFPIKLKFPPMVFVRGFLSHTFLVGIPIALAVRHFSFRYPDGDGRE